MNRSTKDRLRALENVITPEDREPFLVSDRKSGQLLFGGWVGPERPDWLPIRLDNHQLVYDPQSRVGMVKFTGSLQ